MSHTRMDCLFATDMSLSMANGAIRRARLLEEDPRKDERLEIPLCKTCMYMPRLGGAAITKSNCAICGEEIVNASTNTNLVCQTCAKLHDLCAHCGGDVHGRLGRRKFAFDGESK